MTKLQKNKIKQIRTQLLVLRNELEGFSSTEIADTYVRNRYKQLIVELEKETGESFAVFEIETQSRVKSWDADSGRAEYEDYIERNSFKVAVAGLIEDLRERYLPSEISLYYQNETPIISMTNQQTMSSEITLKVAIDLVEHLAKKESEYSPTSSERGFIEKVKTLVARFKDVSSLMKDILLTAQEYHLTLDQLKDIFK